MGNTLEVRLRPERPSTHRRGRRVDSARDVYAVCRDLEGADRERLHVLHLDARNRLLAREEVAVGCLSEARTTGREVFKGAVLSNAAGVVLVHNHPSGDPEPSPRDRELTARLVEVGRWLGIPVLDHVVIGRGGYRSLGGPFPEPAMLQRPGAPTVPTKKGADHGRNPE